MRAACALQVHKEMFPCVWGRAGVPLLARAASIFCEYLGCALNWNPNPQPLSTPLPLSLVAVLSAAPPLCTGFFDGGDCKQVPDLHCPSDSTTQECSGKGVCVHGKEHAPFCECACLFGGHDCSTCPEPQPCTVSVLCRNAVCAVRSSHAHSRVPSHPSFRPLLAELVAIVSPCSSQRWVWVACTIGPGST